MPSPVSKPPGQSSTPSMPGGDPISPIIQQQIQQQEQAAKDLADSIQSGAKGPKDITG